MSFLFPETFFVALQETDVVGYCLAAQLASNRNKAWLLSICVEKEHQNQNFGSYLLLTALRALHQGGCEEIFLSCHPKNQIAKHLFERYGFRVIRTDNSYSGPNEPRHIMHLKINGLVEIQKNSMKE